MAECNKKMNNTKNKIVGEVKEVTGKIVGNEQLELKGSIQSAKADLQKKISIENNIDGIKEKIAKKINNKLDKKK